MIEDLCNNNIKELDFGFGNAFNKKHFGDNTWEIDCSIIIVNWNAIGYLEKCLYTISTNINNLNYEIIVVDNASTDGSVELIKEKFSHVKIFCNDANFGFAKANNIGIKQSTGRYICLINSDVEVLKGCLESMIVYMDKHPDIGMLGPQILDSKRNIQRSCMGFPTLWNTFCRAIALDILLPKSELFGDYLMTFQKHITIQTVDVINGCFWMIKRDALNQVGLLDERFFIYAEDKDWCKRFWEKGWKIVYFPSAQAIHYGGASSSNSPVRFYIEMHRANLQYWKKHHNRPAWLAYLLIIGLHHMIRLFGGIILYIFRPSKRTKTIHKIKRSLACIHWLLCFTKVGYET